MDDRSCLALCRHLGTSTVALTPRQIRETLAITLYRKHRPESLDMLSACIAQMPDSKLTEIIEAVAPEEIDPFRPHRRPEEKAILISHVLRLMESQRCTAKAACELLYRKRPGLAGSATSLYSSFRHHKQAMEQLQKRLDAHRVDCVWSWLHIFGDGAALRLWVAFCLIEHALEEAERLGDDATISALTAEARDLLSETHPFIGVLLMLRSPLKLTYKLWGPQAESLRADDQIDQLDDIVWMFRLFGIFPPLDRSHRPW